MNYFDSKVKVQGHKIPKGTAFKPSSTQMETNVNVRNNQKEGKRVVRQKRQSCRVSNGISEGPQYPHPTASIMEHV